MEFNPKNVIEGWRNHLFPPKHLKEMIEEVSKERLAICRNCEFNSTCGNITHKSKCNSCGCPLTPKSKCLNCECPKGKWQAITTEEERFEIEAAIKKDETEL